MTRVTWYDPTKRSFETGLDRGVLYPKNNRPSVPWNGLTAVDEEGAESAKAYYIDGRPYAFLPSAKEYKATLKAYTYPDEFAEIMGLVEATDGMYLDSQIGGTFDLCYRTLVGNATEGTEHGYKLHLIYNAVVAPQGLSYGSLESTVNPMDFSWEIQAVPVSLPGYRPTAHIIIDSRHLDKSQLDLIEEMLYGSELESISQLPSPSVLYETLNFSEAVIITDNGDGTWTAEGSYKNIYMIGDGIFQIDNIDAASYPNGTYTFFDGAPPPTEETGTSATVLDGGSPGAGGTDVYDGGTAATGGTDIYDGGTPTTEDSTVYDGGTPTVVDATIYDGGGV